MFQDEFVRFYGWGIIVKYHMALYTVGLVSAAGAVRWLMGHRELPIPMLVEMLLVSAAVAALESWILPFDREWEGGTLLWRTVLWTLVCNLGFAGGGRPAGLVLRDAPVGERSADPVFGAMSGGGVVC